MWDAKPFLSQLLRHRSLHNSFLQVFFVSIQSLVFWVQGKTPSSMDKSKRWTLFRHSSSEKRSKSAEKNYTEHQDGEEGLNSSRFHGREVITTEGEQMPEFIQYSQEEWAAIRIQTAFRGFLVRKNRNPSSRISLLIRSKDMLLTAWIWLSGFAIWIGIRGSAMNLIWLRKEAQSKLWQPMLF